jgi:MFS family permease
MPPRCGKSLTAKPRAGPSFREPDRIVPMFHSAVIIPLIVGTAQFMHQFDGAVVATALPSMAAALDEDPIRLNLAITSHLLALAVFVPVSGWIADRFGARRVFVSAILVFTQARSCADRIAVAIQEPGDRG